MDVAIARSTRLLALSLTRGDFHENYIEFCQGEAHDIYHGEYDSCPNLEAVESAVKHVFYSMPVFSDSEDNPYAIESFIELAEEMERVRVDGMMAAL